jgi:hypothetical protein
MSLFEGRGYQYKGKIYPSVTTVCDVLRKPGLESWLGNTPKEQRKKQIERGKRIGSAIHANFDAMFKGIGVDLETVVNEIKPPLLAGIKFILEKRPKTIHSELVVVSENWGFGGTLDRVCKFPDGKVHIIDFKTTNRSKYSGTGIYQENFMQAAAYRKAYEEMFKNETDGTMIVRLDKDNPDGEYEIGIDVNTEASFKAFLAALELFNYQHPDFGCNGTAYMICCEHCYKAYKPKTKHECEKETNLCPMPTSK